MPRRNDTSMPPQAPLRATMRFRPRRPALALGFAGLIGVMAVSGAGLMTASGPNPGGAERAKASPESALSGYRPGGLDVRTAGRALAARAEAIEGCVALTGAGRLQPTGGRATSEPLGALIGILTKSATARAIIDQVRTRRVHVCLDAETDLLAYYFSDLGVIGVNERLSEGGRIAFLAHELGHVPQHPRYSDNRYFPARDLVLLRRVREAAAEAMASRIAWELRTAGHPEAWETKSTGPYRDVAHAFAVVARRHPGPDGLQVATRAAFDRWFVARWRRDVYDRMTLDHLQRISADNIGLVPPRRRLSARFLVGIAALDGGNFLAEADGPLLTDAYYAGRVSNRNTARLNRLLRGARQSARSADDELLPAAGS